MAQAAYNDYLGDSYDPEKGLDIEKVKKKAQREKDKLNIVLMGATGVGKSSLVNAVFGTNIVETGDGKPKTQELKKSLFPKKV
uniref:50S ribosome-binding GTPase n=1 Tax=Conchiformibius kuhniae TaxID=211502 RepID=A0A8T9N0L0_9NEIS|nr:50S ribosome-binding GTPase [Conchiformibius kuhniae]